MSPRPELSPAEGLGFGLALAATGLYFILMSFGVLPPPDETTVRGNAVLTFCAGLAFIGVGLAVAVCAKSGAAGHGSDGDPAMHGPHPAWRVGAIAVAGSLAAIGTWMVIGASPRPLAVAEPLLETRTAGEAIGRTVFALGAVVVWICVIALTVGTVRKLFRRHG
jgi:hypothetical protein